MVWKEVMQVNGVGRGVVYVSTTDGKFEKWMDENHNSWEQESTSAIEFYREIWEAAREQYS